MGFKGDECQHKNSPNSNFLTINKKVFIKQFFI